MEAQAPLWARLLPLGDRKRVLGLVFILTVALIWVAASFFVQGIEAQGAHPAVLTLVANSLFAVYVPVYFLNLRLRRRRQASGAMQQQLETSALVPARQPRSDEGEGDAGGRKQFETSLPITLLRIMKYFIRYEWNCTQCMRMSKRMRWLLE